MNIDILFKIAAIGIALSIIHSILAKAGKEEFASIATLTGVVVVFLMVIGLIGRLFQSVKTLFNL